MADIDRLLVHSVNVIRHSETILDAVSLPVSSTLNQTFSNQSVVFEFAVSAGLTGSFDVVGSNANGAVSERVSFDGSIINKKDTANFYDGITSITSAGGSAVTVTVRAVTRMGQPVSVNSTAFSALACRLDKARLGAIKTTTGLGLTIQDKVTLFTTQGIGTIKRKDEIVEISSGDRYNVIDVDDIFDYDDYHHTESLLGIIS